MHLITKLENKWSKNTELKGEIGKYTNKYNEKFQYPFSKTDITKPPVRKAIEDVKNTINSNWHV